MGVDDDAANDREYNGYLDAANDREYNGYLEHDVYILTVES